MRPRINGFQFMILISNFIFSASIISLPQILAKVSGHNTWLISFITLPVILLFVFLIIGRSKNRKFLENLLVPGNQNTMLGKVFLVLFIIFMSLIMVRDLRGFIDFVAIVLLPNTPIDIMVILSSLVVVYLAGGGLEVIARVTVIQYVILAVIVVALPLLLLNEIELGNLQPIFSMKMFPNVFQSSYVLFSWVGEVMFISVLLAYVAPLKDIRKSAFKGVISVYFVLTVLFLTEVGVLGVSILTVSTYPSHQLIQQINLTDFLDRLDLFIVVVWLPNIFTKLAITLYCLNKAISCLTRHDTKIYMLPFVLVLSLLSILLFKNNVRQLDFSFYTWPTLGLLMEMALLFLFILVKRQHRKKELQGN